MKSAQATSTALPQATLSEYAGVRYLHLDSIWVQGAMRIRKPQVLALDYVQRMMAALLLRPTAVVTKGHAVQLGLGAASLTKFTHKVLRMKTTAVEINPSVIQTCRTWFHLPEEDARLRVLCADAAAWVADAEHVQMVDCLQIDLYDHQAAAPVLDTAVFYQNCYRVLADEGVLSVNLFGERASFERSVERLRRAFGEHAVGHLQPCKEGNTIALACKSARWPERETLQARAQSLHARFGLPAPRWVKLLHPPPLPASP